MSFARPEALWLLTLFPLLAGWVALGGRRRAREWVALGQGGRLRGAGAAGWLGAIVCLIVALSQPRWGRVPAPPLPPGHDVVLLIDTSRSMAAEDAVPNRLGVAVEAAESLLSALGREEGDRAAVVAFAGRGRVRCPLTDNLSAAAEALRALRPGDVQPGGTDLGAALDVAAEAFDDQEHAEGRTLVLFSDGEDLAGNWSRALDRLREAHVVVHAVAIGDAEQGHTIPVGKGRAPLSYHGTPVLSKRSDLPLDTLARATGGAVVKLGLAPADLGALYLQRINPVARQRREAFRLPDRAERFSVFVLAALALGLGGSWPVRGWSGRQRVRVLLFLGMIGVLGAGPARESPGMFLTQGRSAFATGRYPEALAAFERALALDPTNPIAHYDAAATLFQLERFDEAEAHYQASRARAGAVLRTKIDYALGNTALALGDVNGAIGHYRRCLASTASGTAVVAVRRDAAINLRFAEELARRPSAPDQPKAPEAPEKKPQPNDSDDGEKPQPDESPAPGGAPGTRPPSGKRGAGGAGGSGAPSPRTGSPAERLNEALDNIRAAQRRRLPDEPPPAAAQDRKDW